MSVLSILQEINKKNSNNNNYFGIEMGTDDNHEWHVFIDLFDTEYETKDFPPVEIRVNEHNWIKCIKDNEVFKGFGGIQNLEDILHIFCMWAEN